MKNKIFFIILFILTSIIILVVINTTILKKNETITFKIAKAWWPVWDTFQLGIKKYEKSNHKYQTTFTQKDDYVPALNEFINGNADGATLTIYEMLIAASKGRPLKAVLLFDYTIGSDGVVAKKEIKSIVELKGKKIGIEKGTISHFTVLKALEKAGLNQNEVQLVNLNLDEQKKAFINNNIDAVGTYEPYLSELVSKGNGYIVFSSKEIPRAICDVFFVKDSVVANHPDAIDHWIKIWHRILQFKEKDNKQYLEQLSKINHTLVEDLQKSLGGIYFTSLVENRIAFGTKDNPGYLIESIEEMEAFMIKEGVIKEPIPINKLIYYEGINHFFKQ